MSLTNHIKIHIPSKGIICDICGTVTASINSLQHHKKKVHEPKIPRQCEHCGKWYSSRWSMQRHVVNMHVHADEDHTCEICGFVSSTREAKKKHIQYRHNPEKRHKCAMCGKAFKTPTLLKEHMATHTGIDLYQCLFCAATFKSQSNRSTHYKRHHPTEYIPNMTRRTRPTAIVKDNNPGSYIQNFDLNQISSVNESKNTNLMEHFEGNPSEITHTEIIYATKILLHSHIRYHSPSNLVVCDICGKTMRSRDTLKKHKNSVHNKKPKVPEQCSYCGKWYSTRSTLQLHVLNMHIHTDKEHRCEICGFVSTTREAKKKHIRFKHRAEKRHKCGLCDKAFKVPTLLREHMATHTGVDLYKCDYCTATFKSKSNRINHCKRHHPLEYNSSAKSQRRSGPHEKLNSNLKLLEENLHDDEEDLEGVIVYELEENDNVE
ncbi:zinc finger protein OZF-like [Musca vetustissima]|uniref:zinc finger protein OZF-like n=1 Tax=Musca vetustissima TaxID=27455 RepID=UPI002AB77196|nr:zinc finger protein OZF-like [Musca vetustissima]